MDPIQLFFKAAKIDFSPTKGTKLPPSAVVKFSALVSVAEAIKK